MKYCRLQISIRNCQSSQTRHFYWNGKFNLLNIQVEHFFNLYSEKLMGDFADKSTLNFNQELINTLSFTDLFKPGYFNSNIKANLLNSMKLSALLFSNAYLINTLELFKNISRSLNINFPFSNVN